MPVTETTPSVFRFFVEVEQDNGVFKTEQFRYQGAYGVLETWRESLEEKILAPSFNPMDHLLIRGSGLEGHPTFTLVLNPDSGLWEIGGPFHTASFQIQHIIVGEFVSIADEEPA